MNDIKLSIADCLFEAAENFAGKIDTIVTRDPDDTAELACLYSGISGIDACVKSLALHNHLSPVDSQKLKEEIKRLYSRCSPSLK